VGSFATLAIAVAGLGVFGLSAFDVRRRTRDIGVRKALGATPARIAVTVLGRQLISASIASLLAWPFGYWIAGEWLTGYVYRTPLAPAALPLATLIVLVLVALATGANAIRAGAIRPGLALRATG
jgi:putative ABC transport system permease protein